MAQAYRKDPETFWARVDRSGGPKACWLFEGYTNPDGYGMAAGLRGRNELVHRIAWDATYGEVPPPLEQTCGNRTCCNPAHLQPAAHRAAVKTGGRSGKKIEARLVLKVPLTVWEAVRELGGEPWVLSLIEEALHQQATAQAVWDTPANRRR